MGANIGAEVTLDAVLRHPAGNVHSDAALLISSGTLGEGAVGSVFKGRNRQFVALLCVDGIEDVLDEADQFRTCLLYTSRPTAS